MVQGPGRRRSSLLQSLEHYAMSKSRSQDDIKLVTKPTATVAVSLEESILLTGNPVLASQPHSNDVTTRDVNTANNMYIDPRLLDGQYEDGNVIVVGPSRSNSVDALTSVDAMFTRRRRSILMPRKRRRSVNVVGTSAEDAHDEHDGNVVKPPSPRSLKLAAIRRYVMSKYEAFVSSEVAEWKLALKAQPSKPRVTLSDVKALMDMDVENANEFILSRCFNAELLLRRAWPRFHFFTKYFNKVRQTL